MRAIQPQIPKGKSIGTGFAGKKLYHYTFRGFPLFRKVLLLRHWKFLEIHIGIFRRMECTHNFKH